MKNGQFSLELSIRNEANTDYSRSYSAHNSRFWTKPFNFRSANDVQHLEKEGYLRFNATSIGIGESDQRGIAFAKQPIQLPNQGQLSIAFEARSMEEPNGLGIICCLFDEQHRELLVIAQWQQHLVIRSRRSPEATNQNRGYSEIGFRDCFSSEHFTRLEISSDFTDTRIYLDGKQVKHSKGFSLIRPFENNLFQMTVGNDAKGDRPWIGDLKSLVIRSESNSLFEYHADASSQKTNNALVIPELFQRQKSNWLMPFDLTTITALNRRTDIVINILGFIPIGLSLLILARGIETRCLQFVSAVFAAFLVSFLIESLQIYLPSRDSSLLDLVSNSLGGVLSIPVYILVLKSDFAKLTLS